MKSVKISLILHVIIIAVLFSLIFFFNTRINNLHFTTRSMVPPIVIGSMVGFAIWKSKKKILSMNENLQDEIIVRKETEKKLRNAHDELEMRVEERTKEIEDTKEFLQEIMNNMAEGLVAIDRNFNILEANNCYLENVGMDKNEVIGRKCYQISHHADEPCEDSDHLCPIKEVFKTGSPCSAIHTHNTNDGSEQFIEINAYPIKDRKNNFVMGIEISRDITDRKEYEDKLKNYAKELEQSNNLKDLFSDIVRHDLLNPIGIIKNTAEILMEDNPSDEDMKSIYNNSNRAVDLIESATIFSRLETSSEIDKKKLDLKKIIQDISENLEPLFKNAGLELENNLTEPIPVNANPLIEHVFINILTNAIKYANTGKKVIIHRIDNGGTYKIFFEDFGDGVPDKNKEEIFSRFQRNYKGSVKGSGLGLAIVKRLVDLHAGKVWVEDNPNGGSIFVVELPKALEVQKKEG